MPDGGIARTLIPIDAIVVDCNPNSIKIKAFVQQYSHVHRHVIIDLHRFADIAVEVKAMIVKHLTGAEGDIEESMAWLLRDSGAAEAFHCHRRQSQDYECGVDDFDRSLHRRLHGMDDEE